MFKRMLLILALGVNPVYAAHSPGEIYSALIANDDAALNDALTLLSQELEAMEDRLSALEGVPPDPVTPPPTGAITDETLTFEYVVNRNSAGTDNVNNPFVANGWNWVKAINISGSYNGYLYTLPDTSIPGYVGTTNGSRWLAMEGVSEQGSGTDFYVQRGVEGGGSQFPANLGIEFDIVIGPGEVLSDKLIYPTHDTFPAPGNSYSWLIALRDSNFGWLGGRPYERPRSADEFYLLIQGSGFWWERSWGDGPTKMMQTVAKPIRRGVPTTVRIHIDAVNGLIQAFIKEFQETAFTRVIHAQDYVISNELVDGARWRFGYLASEPLPGTDGGDHPRNVNGVAAIRIPTTQGTNNSKYIKRIRFFDWSNL